MEFCVKSDELGKILNLTTRRINQLAQEGILQRDYSGKFDLRKAIPAYIDYQLNESDELKLEKTAHEKIKREKSELELKLMKNELHRSEDVEAVMTDMILRCRSRLLNIPSKAAPLIIGYKDVMRIQNVLQKQIEEALNELADYEPEMFMSEEAQLHSK